MTFPMRRLGWLLPFLCLLVLGTGAWRGLKKPPGPDLRAFGSLPVVANGRVQPIDSLARNALLSIRGKQRVSGKDAPPSPTAWLAELAFQPDAADRRMVFPVLHDEALGLMGLTVDEEKYFSFESLVPRLGKLSEEASRIAAKEPQTWSTYEKAVMKLWRDLERYQQLKFAFGHPATKQLEFDLDQLVAGAKSAAEATAKRERGEDYDATVIEAAEARLRVLGEWSAQTNVLTEPPSPAASPGVWRTLADSALAAASDGRLNPSTSAYARLGTAWRAGDTTTFDSTVGNLRNQLQEERPGDLRKSRAEWIFNQLAPFTSCMPVYIASFVCAFLSWLWPQGGLRTTAFRVLLLGFVIHTVGLITRMMLEGRPPVTNLYSSAIFIGWGAIVLSIVLELFHKNAIGTAVAALTGFATLLIAHHLSLGGDTLEMMRAVLDSNFWLATHVIVITLGYSATFLAGAIAILFLVRHALVGVPKTEAVSMRGMVYGTLCFATLASFVGTVLGGIWADQSWGRFWGWDPKENGALLIVIWNALILHARWGGMIREKGMMVMAVFGNIVTSWSWFGTNMLGIGLHSYGFTDRAFVWLSAFVASQLLVMALAMIPRRVAA
ncbi:cytochrome c biogenesis protein CcsA [Luteolibacter arcticus]|uniref:Cytochrome c biogenesis protein CcsA n=1 Tax=Luteolibacter arcticus TaxID=1581411 RepID=A0ABT3GNT9_9BACT|nr:cytochrome c biogenesis protein CcsA [Luteolibacter arcticus]MCW1925184.1 cytochrome c biogenesis protein CcsA [Luteolibacter arcticus]